MIRGTTVHFKFKLPYAVSECSSIRIEFWQPNNRHTLLPILKTQNDCGVLEDPMELCVSLTPEETMRFSDKYKAKVQIRGTVNGTTFGSHPQLITVYPMHDDIIDSDKPMPEVNSAGIVIFDGREIIN